jgi:hypothetical protein
MCLLAWAGHLGRTDMTTCLLQPNTLPLLPLENATPNQAHSDVPGRAQGSLPAMFIAASETYRHISVFQEITEDGIVTTHLIFYCNCMELFGLYCTLLCMFEKNNITFLLSQHP